MPGIWVPDTPTSHRNTQPGWIIAPGMQGVKVRPVTAGMLTPESLAELMGGPDIAPVQSNLQTPPGPPNAYNEEPGPPPHRRARHPPPSRRRHRDPRWFPARSHRRRRRTVAAAGRHRGPALPAEAARTGRRWASDGAISDVASPPPGLAGGVRWRPRGSDLLRLAGHLERPLPGGPGNGAGPYTVYVQMPDTLAINGNSRVMVADVFVGSSGRSS